MKSLVVIVLLIFTLAFDANGQTDVLNLSGDSTEGVNLGSTSRLSGSRITIELWLKPLSFNEKAYFLSTVSQSSSHDLFTGWKLGTRADQTFEFSVVTTERAILQLSSKQSGAEPRCNFYEPNRWYHLAASYDRHEGEMILYVDGIRCNSKNIENQRIAYPSQGVIALGGVHHNDASAYSGQVSELRFWTTSRTQQQIRDVMSERIEPQSTLVGAWPFNEGSGNSLNEINGNFAAAKLSGKAQWGQTFLPLGQYNPPQPTCQFQHCGWYTQGTQIIAPDGKPFKIKAINWFGFQSSTNLVHGLWQVDFLEQIDKIKALGFNTIRLPFANSTLYPEAKVSGFVADLPGNRLFYEGMPALEALDAFINVARVSGLYVILDRHKLVSDSDNPPLWYDDKTTEAQWIDDWQFLAERYRDNPAVIGADLHNEPNGIATWGNGQVLTDWRLAAEKAANAVLTVNPDWLIFVEGIDWSDDFFINEHLSENGVHHYPIRLHTENKVVYSPHEYGPNDSGHRHRWFYKGISYEEATKVWDSTWGYILEQQIAPVFVGEFGGHYVDIAATTPLNYPNDPDSEVLTQGDAAIWFQYIVRYLKAKDVNFAYWGWTPNSINTGGLLNDNWQLIREKLVAINPLMQVPLSLTTEADDYVVPELQNSILPVLSNDSSSYSDLSIVAVSEPGKGVLAFNAGELVYTPFGNACGMDGFDYTVTDGLLQQSVEVKLTIVLMDDRDGDCVRNRDDRWPDDPRYAFDNDVDNLPDNWELEFFGTIDAVTALLDSDGDGLNNIQEWMDGTDPTDNRSGGTNGDLDEDGMVDSWEVLTFGTITRDGTGDYDRDGLSDAQEFAMGLDPKFNSMVIIPITKLLLKDN